MSAKKTDHLTDIELPPISDFKFTEYGDLILNLVYVGQSKHRTCRLELSRAQTYIELIKTHKQQPNILQTYTDILREIAT